MKQREGRLWFAYYAMFLLGIGNETGRKNSSSCLFVYLPVWFALWLLPLADDVLELVFEVGREEALP